MNEYVKRKYIITEPHKMDYAYEVEEDVDGVILRHMTKVSDSYVSMKSLFISAGSAENLIDVLREILNANKT